jgi:hypothetical protein
VTVAICMIVWYLGIHLYLQWACKLDFHLWVGVLIILLLLSLLNTMGKLVFNLNLWQGLFKPCDYLSVLWFLLLLKPVEHYITEIFMKVLLRRGVLDTTLCDKDCQWLTTGRWFSPVSSINKTDHHNITEILLKMELNTIKPNLFMKVVFNTHNT